MSVMDPDADFINDTSTREQIQAMMNNLRNQVREQASAAAVAKEALARLVHVMGNRTGQSYKLRALLYSLYNGQATSLLEIVCLDWAIRKDLVAVLLAFGGNEFFYDQMKETITAAGQWPWFIEEDTEPGQWKEEGQ